MLVLKGELALVVGLQELTQLADLGRVGERTFGDNDHLGIGRAEDENLRGFDHRQEIAPIVMEGVREASTVQTRSSESIGNRVLVSGVGANGFAGGPVEGNRQVEEENRTDDNECQWRAKLRVQEIEQEEGKGELQCVPIRLAEKKNKEALVKIFSLHEHGRG